MKSILIVLLLSLLSSVSLADLNCPTNIIFEEFVDVKTNAGFTELSLNGVGLKKIFLFKVFYGALYLQKNSSNGDSIVNSKEIKVFTVHALRNISKKQLVDEWTDEFERLCAEDCKKLQPFHDQLMSYARDVNKNERFSLAFLPNRLEFIPTGGEDFPPIKSVAYGKLMLKAAVGSDAGDDKLKKGLLGQDSKLCKEI